MKFLKKKLCGDLKNAIGVDFCPVNIKILGILCEHDNFYVVLVKIIFSLKMVTLHMKIIILYDSRMT